MTTSQLGSKLRLQPPHRHTVAPPILQDLHPHRGSYNLPPPIWPTTAPRATLPPKAPPTTNTTSRRPTKASSLLCPAPPVHPSPRNNGEFLIRCELSCKLIQSRPSDLVLWPLQVSAAAVGALPAFPPPGENGDRLPAVEPRRAAAVPAPPLGAPGPPSAPGFQTGAGGSAIPRVGSRSGPPGPERFQPRHHQTGAERLWLRLR